MKAVLLGAGKGTRLAPITHRVPKILAPLGGVPLLHRQLDYLAANGIDEVAVNVHHHADLVERALAERPSAVPVRLSHEERLLGTAGALVPLRDFLDGPFILLYGDVVTDAPLRTLAAAHARSGALATLACYPSEETRGKGTLELDVDGRVTAFAEKAATGGNALVNAGIYALDPGVLAFVEGEAPDFGHDVWPAALAAGALLRGWPLDGYLRDIGAPDALAAAENDLAAGRIAW